MKEDIFCPNFRSILCVHESCHLLALNILYPESKFVDICVNDYDGYITIDENIIDSEENMIKILLSGFIGCGIIKTDHKSLITKENFIDFLSLGAGNGDWCELRKRYSLKLHTALRLSNEISPWFKSKTNLKYIGKVSKALMSSPEPLKYEDIKTIINYDSKKS